MAEVTEEKKSLTKSVEHLFTVVNRLEDILFGPSPNKTSESGTPIDSKIDGIVSDLLKIRNRLERIAEALNLVG